MKRKDVFSATQNLALVGHVGLAMMIPIFFGIIGGHFIDEKLGTGSIFLIIGIVVGVMASFMNLYNLAMRKSGEHKNRKW